jgi:hypothetical protein
MLAQLVTSTWSNSAVLRGMYVNNTRLSAGSKTAIVASSLRQQRSTKPSESCLVAWNHAIIPLKLPHMQYQWLNRRTRPTMRRTELGPAVKPNKSEYGGGERQIYYRVADLCDSFPTPTHSTRSPVTPPATPFSSHSTILKTPHKMYGGAPSPGSAKTRDIYIWYEEVAKMRKIKKKRQIHIGDKEIGNFLDVRLR